MEYKTNSQRGLNTHCTHTGEIPDPVYRGSVSPIYPSTSYEYEDVDIKRYPRYFNTPNQEGVARKIAALEKAEDALVFGSGMAAISTALLSFLRQGDHVILPESIYGGTFHLATTQFPRQGISFDFVRTSQIPEIQSAIRPNTRVIYLESPSNPTLELTDLSAVSRIAAEQGILTMMDNTFASPVNQNPLEWGIDLAIHSATKYMGGHSDLCAGAIAGRSELIESIWNTAICYGGNLSDYSVWMLERSLKTLGIRVQRQNENAGRLASYLSTQDWVERVYYPGLNSFPQFELARRQMRGFGGMLSFTLSEELPAIAFLKALKLVKPAMSLAGVESTALQPSQTSHSLMPVGKRLELGITDQLIRFSAGIEELNDIVADLEQARNWVGERQNSL